MSAAKAVATSTLAGAIDASAAPTNVIPRNKPRCGVGPAGPPELSWPGGGELAVSYAVAPATLALLAGALPALALSVQYARFLSCYLSCRLARRPCAQTRPTLNQRLNTFCSKVKRVASASGRKRGETGATHCTATDQRRWLKQNEGQRIVPQLNHGPADFKRSMTAAANPQCS